MDINVKQLLNTPVWQMTGEQQYRLIQYALGNGSANNGVNTAMETNTPFAPKRTRIAGVILNKEIDVLTLGVYVIVLCLGKKWKLNVRGLASTLGISANKFRAAFSAFEKTGYLKRTRAHDKNGKFCGWDYTIGYEPITDIAKSPTPAHRLVNKAEEEETDKSLSTNQEQNQEIKSYGKQRYC